MKYQKKRGRRFRQETQSEGQIEKKSKIVDNTTHEDPIISLHEPLGIGPATELSEENDETSSHVPSFKMSATIPSFSFVPVIVPISASMTPEVETLSEPEKNITEKNTTEKKHPQTQPKPEQEEPVTPPTVPIPEIVPTPRDEPEHEIETQNETTTKNDDEEEHNYPHLGEVLSLFRERGKKK